MKQRKQQLENEIPLFPGKIDEVKKTLTEREATLAEMLVQEKNAAGALALLEKANKQKEQEAKFAIKKSYAQGQKNVTVLSATWSAPKNENLAIQGITVQNSLHLPDGQIIMREGEDSEYAVSDAISHLELWDTSKRLAGATQNPNGLFFFQFADDSPLLVKKGEAKTLYLKADISESAESGERHRLDVVGTTATASAVLWNMKETAPIFVIGETHKPTITLDGLQKEEGKVPVE
jgi:hypothetical protein